MPRVTATLNGLVIFNEDQGYVAKILSAQREPSFVANTERSAELIPEHVPQLLSAGVLGDLGCVFSELLDTSRLQPFANWETMLRAVTAPLEKLYLRGGIVETVTGEMTNLRLTHALRTNLTSQQFLQSDFEASLNLVTNLLTIYHQPSLTLTKLFCHGDLTPNNVVHDGQGQITILDWANGGVHAAFYDLMIQGVYTPTARVWQEFDTIDFIANEEADIFHGWSKTFCQLIAKLTQTTLTNETIRFSLIVALAEMAMKNFLRHQTIKDQAEGGRVLALINQILQQLVG